MGFLKDTREEAKRQAEEAKRQAEEAKLKLARRREARADSGLEYRVDMLREKLIGDHIGHDKLERLLNDRAGEGWALKSIVRADVQGRVAGGTEGLLIVFERPTI